MPEPTVDLEMERQDRIEAALEELEAIKDRLKAEGVSLVACASNYKKGSDGYPEHSTFLCLCPQGPGLDEQATDDTILLTAIQELANQWSQSKIRY